MECDMVEHNFGHALLCSINNYSTLMLYSCFWTIVGTSPWQLKDQTLILMFEICAISDP